VVLRGRRFGVRTMAIVLLGAIAGFLIGEPYILVRPREIIEQISKVVRTSQAIPDAYRIPAAHLLWIHGKNMVRFLVGLPAALLAIAGLVMMFRRRAEADWIPVVMLAGGIASFVPLLWPMLRYQVPFLPLLALTGAIALDSCPARLRAVIGGAALLLPL